MSLGIEYLDYYIPNDRVKINELVNQFEDNEQIPYFNSKLECLRFLKEELLLESIPVENRLKDFEMLDLLVSKMILEKKINPESIDAVIFTQEHFNYYTDNLAQYIQYKYKMNNAFCFEVSGNHCNNVELSIKMAKALMKDDEKVDRILILSAQKIKTMKGRIIGRSCVLGDAAGILLLDRNAQQLKIKDTYNMTNGYFYDTKPKNNEFLYHYKYSTECIKNILVKNSISPSEVKKVIVPNINPSPNIEYFKRFDIGEDRIYLDNVGKNGHLTSIDFIYNLKKLQEIGELSKNDIILTLGMGWAGSYQTSLINY